MKRSILTDNLDVCFVCGRRREEIHHIYYGSGRRPISDKNGFIVPLCSAHHRGIHGVHFNKKLDLAIKRLCQKEFEKTGTREDFLKLIGRNYL